MRQIVQSARTGRLALREVPEPKVRPGHLLVRTRASLISAGTERLMLGFARKSLAGKARARPDLVRKVLEKARRDGIGATLRAVRARLDEPIPLGYSAAGAVEAVGAGLEGRFRVGERVAVAGAGVANHAELNIVPENLAVPVPDSVADEEACFATLGAIALHAVRLAEARLGDVVGVIGVGLVGQLACQLLALAGARVVALDYDRRRLDLARQLGAELALDLAEGDPAPAVAALSAGMGCDGVLIAAASEDSTPFATAAAIARDRARVTVVGMTGTAFPYREFMQKELSIAVSRSYGPGRYDRDYEGRGVKYPEGYVRWTETANLAECVRLMRPELPRRLRVGPLISHRFEIGRAEEAYTLVAEAREPHLGVVLGYPERPAARPAIRPPAARPGAGGCVLGMIGAGAFARTQLLTELKRLPAVRLAALATLRPISAEHTASRFGFARVSADADAVLADAEVNAVLIASPHSSHAELAARALEAGKAVLVEKPLALDRAGLNRVIEARNRSTAFFQVGFNRRFAPFSARARRALDVIPGPRNILVRVNAGPLAADSWVGEPEEGGGRVLGELCHFVDLAAFLAGDRIVSVAARAARAAKLAEEVSVTLSFAEGSLATLVYSALGDPAAAKELVEVYAGGTVIAIDDFRRLSVTGPGRGGGTRARLGQDKGHAAELRAFVAAVANGGPPPVDEDELIRSSLASLAVLESLRSGAPVAL
ncbi:MAG: bi-domain-containing oxidoreductase [Proteobacteria bacterium]|nr:bi-domain-containing oxidoreductase [Pseudomonadota bacterium]